MTSSLLSVATRAQFNGVAYRPAGYIIVADGTVYPGAPFPPQPLLNNGTGWWSGFSSGMVGGLANQQDGLWKSWLDSGQSLCLGYSATTIPMWPSVQELRGKIVAAMHLIAVEYAANNNGVLDGLAILWSGYSQSSMAFDQVWALDVLPVNGELHYLLPYIYRIYQFGHIFRTPGIAHGNGLAGLAESIIQDGVETGGIGTGLDLTVAQTNYLAPDGKPVVCSCANKGDLYSACSVGLNPWTAPAPEGKVGKLFMAIIMQPTLAAILSTAKVLGEPIQAIMELFHTLAFFAQGMNSPHYQYFPQMTACINDALTLGNSLPHSGC